MAQIRDNQRREGNHHTHPLAGQFRLGRGHGEVAVPPDSWLPKTGNVGPIKTDTNQGHGYAKTKK